MANKIGGIKSRYQYFESFSYVGGVSILNRANAIERPYMPKNRILPYEMSTILMLTVRLYSDRKLQSDSKVWEAYLMSRNMPPNSMLRIDTVEASLV